MSLRRMKLSSSSHLMAPLLLLVILSQTSKTTLARPMPRIIGGQDATAGSYPFFASLTMGGSHSCGGTLIAPDIILSAAHCQNLTRAEVGRSVRTDPNDTYETFDLIQEIRHPVYDSNKYKYDFMILQLDRPASDQFKPIRVNQNESLPEIGVAEGVKAIGFGVTEYFYDGSHSGIAEILQEVGLVVMTNEQCMMSMGTETTNEAYADGYAGLITPDMLCAMDDQQDTCLGECDAAYAEIRKLGMFVGFK
jgi:secreted trypsin-like serine protease